MSTPWVQPATFGDDADARARTSMTAQVARRERRRRAAAVVVRVVGVVALAGAAWLPVRERLDAVLQVTGMGVPPAAAGLLAMAGCALLVVSSGLRRGSRLAWAAATGLLTLAVPLHLLRGLDVEGAALSLAAAAWLVSQRRAFPVLPSRPALTRALALGVGGAVLAVGASTAATLLVERHHHLGWQHVADASAHGLLGQPEHLMFGRTLGGPVAAPLLPIIGVGLLCAVLALVFSPHRPRTLSPAQHRRERERARSLVQAHGRDSLAYFALRDDKDWFFAGSSVVAYAVHGDVCLVSPDPIGPLGEREAVWAEFRTFAERHGWTVAVVGASASWLSTYQAAGMRAVYLGDEAVVDTSTFTLRGQAMKSVRQAVTRVARAGIVCSFHDPATLEDDLREALTALATESRRGADERGFSMTLSRLFDPADQGLMLTVARDAHQRPVGFIQWVPAPEMGGWSLDVMRRSTEPDLPNGIVDAMVAATAEHVRDAKASRTPSGTGGVLTLNFAVLRTLVAGELPGRLAAVGRELVTRAGSASQMQSLARFNAKFDPTWVPRYVVLDAVGHAPAGSLAIARAEGLVEDVPVLRHIPHTRRRVSERAAPITR